MTGTQVGTKIDPTFSCGVGDDDLVRTIKAETWSSSYTAGVMVFTNFFSTAIISCAVVFIVYEAWNLMFTYAFQFGRDLVWNGIDIEVCPLTLLPLVIALWVMNWLCLVYYKCYISYTYTVEVC